MGLHLIGVVAAQNQTSRDEFLDRQNAESWKESAATNLVQQQKTSSLSGRTPESLAGWLAGWPAGIESEEFGFFCRPLLRHLVYSWGSRLPENQMTLLEEQKVSSKCEESLKVKKQKRRAEKEHVALGQEEKRTAVQ